MEVKLKMKVKNVPLLTTKEVRASKISKSSITKLCKEGTLERVSRGVYLNHNSKKDLPIEYEDLFYTVMSIKHGVICLISALSYYDLTEEIPRKFWIAIPANKKPLARDNIKFIRLRNYELGIKTINISGVKVNIYDVERTIVDSFRFLSIETAIKALKEYFKTNPKPDISKLLNYSRILRVNIKPYIEVLTINA